MTPVFTEIRHALHTERERLITRTAGWRDLLVIEWHADDADERADATARELEAAELRRSRKLLADVNVALARMALGCFGICVDCDGEISMLRLRALPHTAVCVRCAENRERRND